MRSWQITLGERTFTDADIATFGTVVDLSLLTGDGYRIDPIGEPRHLLALLAVFAARDGSASALEWIDRFRAMPADEVLATLGEAPDGDGN